MNPRRTIRRSPLPTLGLRARLLVLGVLGLTVGLAAGGLLLIGVLGWTLQRAVDDEAFRTADAVALLAAEDALPDPLPVAGGQGWVQVVDVQGRVRAASIEADRLVPMVRPGELTGAGRQARFVPGERLGLAGRARVVAVPAGTAADPFTVLVARSMADVTHSAEVVRTILLVSFPLLVAVLAGVAWRVVGATLRPVEALRSGAEEITGQAGAGRLPVPASRDEIHRLAVTLNGMLDRLAAARDRQRAFVSDAAHELRSPLTNMRTELEVAQRLGERTDWPAVARDLLDDTERMARLVDDLLLLARLDEAGDTTGAPLAGSSGAPVPVAPMTPMAPVAPAGAGRGGHRGTGPVELGGLVAAVAARWPSPPVRVLASPGPHWTVGDPDRLHRILANLIDNAARHARTEVLVQVTGPHPDGRRVAAGPRGAGVAPGLVGATAAGERPGGTAYHLVTVTDDGPGIPAADRERVFDRFTRLDDARARDAGGAGLGLAIVRELVRLHGGTVTLGDATGQPPDGRAPADPDPRPAPGLRVCLHLPALADPDL